MDESVIYQIDGSIATITLNRPDRLNAWNDALVAELHSHLRAAADPHVRTVVLTGAGKAFSSGADLKDVGARASEAGQTAKISDELRKRYNPLLMTVKQLGKPVIAAINGPAVGIGLSLALACDLVIAKESAVFLVPFVNIGLVPDGGSTALLPAAVGMARAAELSLLGEPIDGKRAAEIGLIARAVPDDDFDSEIAKIAAKLAAGPTLAYANTKRALNRSQLAEFAAALELEADLQDECAQTSDFREGVSAFIEKRTARFTGK